MRVKRTNPHTLLHFRQLRGIHDDWCCRFNVTWGQWVPRVPSSNQEGEISPQRRFLEVNKQERGEVGISPPAQLGRTSPTN